MRSTATRCTGTPSLWRCDGIDNAEQEAIVPSVTDLRPEGKHPCR